MLFSKVKGIVDFRQLEQFNIDDGEKKLIENSSTERQKQRIARERENGRMKNAPIEKTV
jgi:FtsZ-binding cell division protein ZapB